MAELEQCKQECKALEQEITELLGDPDHSPLPDICKDNPTLVGLKTRRHLKGHFGKIYALHWSSDSKKVVSASQDGKLIIWNCASSNKLNAIPLRSSWVMTCAYSPDESLVACGGLDNLCSVYKQDSESSKPEFELAQHEGYLSCCRFLGNDKIVSCSGDSTCILWDIKKEAPTKCFHGHKGDVVSLDIMADNPNCFISGSCDFTVKLWDVRENTSNQSSMTFYGHESDVNSVCFFPSGNALGSGSDDSSCRLFDIRANRQMCKYADAKLLTVVTSVSFSKTGRFLFAGNDDCLAYVWDTQLGHLVSTLEGHVSRVSCLATSPNGKAVCTGSWDYTLKIWA